MIWSCLLVFSPRTVESFFRQEAGHRTQGGQDLRTVGGANRTAIFVVGSVPHVVMSIFDAPSLGLSDRFESAVDDGGRLGVGWSNPGPVGQEAESRPGWVLTSLVDPRPPGAGAAGEDDVAGRRPWRVAWAVPQRRLARRRRLGAR